MGIYLVDSAVVFHNTFSLNIVIYKADSATYLFNNRGLFIVRRGSRINTDRFPKRAPKAQASSGVREKAPPGKKLDFYYLKSPFLGFQVIQTECWPDGNLESVFIIKNIQEKLSSLETY